MFFCVVAKTNKSISRRRPQHTKGYYGAMVETHNIVGHMVECHQNHSGNF